MTGKGYDWKNGVPLLDHTARKLKVLGEYFAEYLRVRCGKIPQQELFKLAIVDGFSGGGRYLGGEMGSPLVFLDTISRTIAELDSTRAANGFRPLSYDCLLVANDLDLDAVECLRKEVQPLIAQIKETQPQLRLEVQIENKAFEVLYPSLRDRLDQANFRNVIFNLDQCGDKRVPRDIIVDIMQHFNSGEVFLTFMIKSLLAYLKKNDPLGLRRRLAHLDLPKGDLDELDGVMSRNDWLGAAERIVFDHLSSAAPFASPFSIHNPDGWRYWLMHFAKSPRARQVYNDVLHANSNAQAHFGRAGLDMFSFDPRRDDKLYLFAEADRVSAREQLLDDLPRTIAGFGDAVTVAEFYQQVYSRTPSHSDDIRTAIFESPDVEILTDTGGTRRKAGTIREDDILRVARQRSFFSRNWGKD